MNTQFSLCRGAIFALVLGALTAPARGDSPTAINYQAVARNLDGTPVANSLVTVRLAIRSGTPTGTALYQETHSVTTTSAGQFAVVIGSGTQVSAGAAFADLSWTTILPRFLQTELSISGGPFVNMGATQFVSVPYALEANHASIADKLANPKLVPIATGSIDETSVYFDDTSSTVPISVQSGSGGFISSGTLTVRWDETNNWYVVGVTGYDLSESNCVVMASPLRNGTPTRTHSTGFIDDSGTGRITVKFARLRSTAEGELVDAERGKCAFFIAVYKL